MSADGLHLGEVALAGDHVVVTSDWFTYPMVRANTRVFSAAPGEDPVQIAVSAAPLSMNWVTVAGSSSQVVVRRYGADDGVLAGPPTGPLSLLERCTPLSYDYSRPREVAVDGELSAWPCGGQTIVIRDGAGRRALEQPSGRAVSHVDVAGRFVAWVEDNSFEPDGRTYNPDPGPHFRLIVYDTAAGAERYHIDGLPQVLDQLELRSDGSAVITSPVGTGPVEGCPFPDFGLLRVASYSATEPFPHESPVRICRAAPVRVAGDRLAFVRPGGAWGVLSLVDLDGQGQTDVAELAPGGNLRFDFDGQRVAWSQSRCTDDAVEWRDAADTAPPEPAPECSVELGRPRVDRHGVMRLPVSCPQGCSSVRHYVWEGIAIESPKWLKTYYARIVTLQVPPGGHRLVTMQLTRNQRARLRRHRPGRITLRIFGRNIGLSRELRPTYSG
jgi:hypothetical protein